MKSDKQRIADLEMLVYDLQRKLAAFPTRLARAQQVKTGWWLGRLTEELTQGGTADVAVIVWDQAAWAYSGVTIEVQDFYLNLGETIPADTKVEIAWYRNVWIWRVAYCAASDTLPA